MKTIKLIKRELKKIKLVRLIYFMFKEKFKNISENKDINPAMYNPAMYNHNKSGISEHSYAKVLGTTKYISIIYNYFNKQDTLFRSLDSIEKQELKFCSPEDIEVIIIDDGSSDNTIIDKLPENITYLWQRKNGYGISRAKNTGARISNGKYLVFLDPDILISPQFINNMLINLQNYGKNLVQSGYIHDYYFKGCPDPRTEFGVWEMPNRPTRRFYQLAGGCMAISRELFFQTTGFDEDLIYGGVEDLLFGYHLGKLSDTQILFNRQMESWHIPHPPSGAHAEPMKSWNIVKKKYPDFYHKYVTEGLR